MILAAGIAIGCLVLLALFILGFLAPRLSRREQASLDKGIEQADEHSTRAPWPFDKLADHWLRKSRKAADKSSEAGRRKRDGTS